MIESFTSLSHFTWVSTLPRLWKVRFFSTWLFPLFQSKYDNMSLSKLFLAEDRNTFSLVTAFNDFQRGFTAFAISVRIFIPFHIFSLGGSALAIASQILGVAQILCTMFTTTPVQADQLTFDKLLCRVSLGFIQNPK